MIKPGLKGHKEMIAKMEHSASVVGSGGLEVFSTPAMIALMENTAASSIDAHLEEGQGSVGTLVHIRHIAASPLGMKIMCESELLEIDRRRLVFSVKAYDEKGLIGEGTHERFIIDNEKFMQKLR